VGDSSIWGLNGLQGLIIRSEKPDWYEIRHLVSCGFWIEIFCAASRKWGIDSKYGLVLAISVWTPHGYLSASFGDNRRRLQIFISIYQGKNSRQSPRKRITGATKKYCIISFTSSVTRCDNFFSGPAIILSQFSSFSGLFEHSKNRDRPRPIERSTIGQ
jgi:hypothetical protein